MFLGNIMFSNQKHLPFAIVYEEKYYLFKFIKSSRKMWLWRIRFLLCYIWYQIPPIIWIYCLFYKGFLCATHFNYKTPPPQNRPATSFSSAPADQNLPQNDILLCPVKQNPSSPFLLYCTFSTAYESNPSSSMWHYWWMHHHGELQHYQNPKRSNTLVLEDDNVMNFIIIIDLPEHNNGLVL